jgi:lipopolysaccharide biosynthesis glycosyltransferase
MSDSIQPIRLFIGSSPKNSIEEKVFRYTLQKYTNSPIEINVIDGTTGSVTTMGTGSVKTLPTHLVNRIKGATAFSMARWAIPEWCGYQGRAIYCDSDQLALADLSTLWTSDLQGATLAIVPAKQAKSSRHFFKDFLKDYVNTEETYYLTSVMLMDCEKAAVWSLKSLVDSLDCQNFSLGDLMYVSSAFRDHFNLTVANLPSEWNHLDYVDRSSKIVHFSDLTTQPWRFHHHSLSSFWEAYYLEAVQTGFLTEAEILKAGQEHWITERTKALALMNRNLRWVINPIWRTWGTIAFLIQQFIHTQTKRVRSLPRKLSAGFNRMKGAY